MKLNINIYNLFNRNEGAGKTTLINKIKGYCECRDDKEEEQEKKEIISTCGFDQFEIELQETILSIYDFAG